MSYYEGIEGDRAAIRAMNDLRDLRRSVEEWVPWKAGDELPMPQFGTFWLCTVRRMGTIDPTWLAVRSGGQFEDGTSTEVIAYLPRPLPLPFTAK